MANPEVEDIYRQRWQETIPETYRPVKRKRKRISAAIVAWTLPQILEELATPPNQK